MNVNWAIAHEKLESNPAEPKLSEAIVRQGHKLFLSHYKNFRYEDCPPDESCPTVLHGPIQFIRQNRKNFCPGAYGFNDDVNVSSYISKSNLTQHFLNNGIFVTIAQIKNSFKFFIDMHGGEFFIRPNSGYKTFQGFIVGNPDDFDLDVRTQNIANETMCLISTVKEIEFEFRFVVCENGVITGSQYLWDDRKDVRSDILSEARELAQMVSSDTWQPDLVYTVDIAILKGSNRIPKIIEFNSFSSSGLYQCNRDIIVERVSDAARKTWKENYD